MVQNVSQMPSHYSKMLQGAWGGCSPRYVAGCGQAHQGALLLHCQRHCQGGPSSRLLEAGTYLARVVLHPVLIALLLPDGRPFSRLLVVDMPCRRSRNHDQQQTLCWLHTARLPLPQEWCMQVRQQASISGGHHTHHALLPTAILQGCLRTPLIPSHNTSIFASVCSVRLVAFWSVFRQAAPALHRHRPILAAQFCAGVTAFALHMATVLKRIWQLSCGAGV